MTPRFIGTLACFVLAAACSAPRPSLDSPAGIVIPDDASELASQGQGEGFDASYKLRRAYPAEGFLATARAQLVAAGFQPLDKDWLNPTIDSSHVRGWTKFTQGADEARTQVHQWSAQWRDSGGNVVLYHLQYVSPRTTVTMLEAPTTDVLNVAVARIPAAQAAALRQSAAGVQPK